MQMRKAITKSFYAVLIQFNSVQFSLYSAKTVASMRWYSNKYLCKYIQYVLYMLRYNMNTNTISVSLFCQRRGCGAVCTNSLQFVHFSHVLIKSPSMTPDNFSFWPSASQMKNDLQSNVLSSAGNGPLPCCDTVTHQAPLSPRGNTLCPDVWIST